MSKGKQSSERILRAPGAGRTRDPCLGELLIVLSLGILGRRVREPVEGSPYADQKDYQRHLCNECPSPELMRIFVHVPKFAVKAAKFNGLKS